MPKAKLDTMSDHGVHQGMVLAITAYQYLTLEELLEQTKEKTATPFFLILDSQRTHITLAQFCEQLMRQAWTVLSFRNIVQWELHQP